jgi:hypothetical protein
VFEGGRGELFDRAKWLVYWQAKLRQRLLVDLGVQEDRDGVCGTVDRLAGL